MKKKLATTLLAGALSASMVVPAFASHTNGVTTADTGTQVWAGVVIQDKDPVVKVEVPTLFAFVVNGTTDATDNSAIISDNNALYLPNVKVQVNHASGSLPGAAGNTADYELTYYSDGIMRMNNYSTYLEDDGNGTNTMVRKGLGVELTGEIRETSVNAVDKNYWQYKPLLTAPVDTDLDGVLEGHAAEFKWYTISVENIKLDSPTINGYEMATPITLAAPDIDPAGDGSNLNLDSNNLAILPTTLTAAFDVEVGGERSQYKQVEQSAQVGTIVWTVSVDVSQEDVYTAPENEYLDGVDSGAGTDPDGI